MDLVCLVGSLHSGKSSIVACCFTDIMPHETCFLESTTDVTTTTVHIAHHSFMLMEIPHVQDVACAIEGIAYGRLHVVCVVDYGNVDHNVISSDTFAFLQSTCFSCSELKIASFHVLLHKMDCHTTPPCQDDLLSACSQVRQICQLVNGCSSVHFTSIYEHSCLQAMSTIMRMIHPRAVFYETMSNRIVDQLMTSVSVMCFDVSYLLLLGSDTLTPVDQDTEQLVTDACIMVRQFSSIYTNDPPDEATIRFKDMHLTCFGGEDVLIVVLSSKPLLPLQVEAISREPRFPSKLSREKRSKQ
jgi:hypothetical protein